MKKRANSLFQNKTNLLDRERHQGGLFIFYESQSRIPLIRVE